VAPGRAFILLLCLPLAGLGLWAGWQLASPSQPSATRTPAYYRLTSENSAASGQSAELFNVYVGEPGPYELTAADLRAVGANFTVQNAALTWRGQPVALEVIGSGEEARLRFYGHASDSAYTVENIYQLQAGTSLMMPDAPPVAPGTEPSLTYTATLRAEQNLLYTPQAADGETWFWQVMPAPSQNRFEVTVDPVSDSPAVLRLRVWSNTQADANPDHHLQVSLNEQRILDTTWDGDGTQILQAIIPAGLLRQGVNVVEVNLPGDTGAAAERTHLDWIEIQRSLPAEGGQAWLEGTGTPIQFSGNDLTLWQVNSVTETLRLPAGDGVSIIPGKTGQRYLVASPSSFRTPKIQPAISGPNLRQLSPANYIAFGPPDLLTASQPLLDWRTQHGLTTLAIPLQAVYDQFGSGFPEPQAIQRFLAYTAQNWPQPPRDVLLLGDFTFDPHGYTVSPEANRLPTFFIQTHYGGQTASDVPFADLDSDGLPDLSLGRLPARTPAEVQIYVEKALRYEQESDIAWRSRMFTIADGQDASFADDAQAFDAHFTNPIFEKNLFTPPAGSTDANSHIAASFEDGFGVVSYFGHGSVNMWGKDRLFTTDDVAALTNADHLPVIINMNCLTGLFTHPKVTSLAETFLWQPNGGAVAVLAPTSLTLPSDQALLSEALAGQINTHPEQTLGESYLAAQRQMPIGEQGANEVLLTFLLFGDPALHPWTVTQN
jgi:hypothetical protein